VVDAWFDLPQGLMLDVRLPEVEGEGEGVTTKGSIVIPYRPEMIVQVDVAGGRVVIDPPAGFLDWGQRVLSVNIVTIFPEFFRGPLSLSIPARAAAAGSVAYRIVDLREHTHDRHRSVDDAPYGGGPGMVMAAPPFFEAVEALAARAPIVLLSARGAPLMQRDVDRYAVGDELTLLCGHYKDVDQRVADFLATEERSVGEVVLSGGEAAALVVVDATVRLLAGAMSDPESARTDSFAGEVGRVSAPSYTRPPEFRGHGVPAVLLSGDHARIATWRRSESDRRTEARRATVRLALADVGR
jgi:tRNA (guanine37-N1)-methyltransferase